MSVVAMKIIIVNITTVRDTKFQICLPVIFVVLLLSLLLLLMDLLFDCLTN